MNILKFFTAVFTTLGLLARGSNCLTIDNQLVIIANDCYTRIAIGSILPSKEITASVMAATVTECEDECSRKRNTCEIFSFGISSKGNATCLLGTRVPNPEELDSNPDYDIYIRQQSSPNCMPDRLYKLGSGTRNPTNFNNDSTAEAEKNGQNDTSSRGPKPGKRPIIGTVPLPNAERIPTASGNHQPNYPNYPSYQVAEEAPNFPVPGYTQPGNIYDHDNPNGPSVTYGNRNPYGIFETGGYGGAGQLPTGGHRVQGNSNFNFGYDGSDGPEDFYPGDHRIGAGNQGDYYAHGTADSGNRYGINHHDTPDTICKQRHEFD